MTRRIRRPVPVRVDGETWPSMAEYRQAQDLAVGVTGQDVRLIDQLVRHCEDASRRGRSDMVHSYHWDTERRRQDLVRELYQRAGAATATEGDPQTVPLTLAEIKMIEDIRYKIQYFSGYYLGSQRDPMLDKADDLLNRLHFLAGHARATASLGGVAVFKGHGWAALPPGSES